MGQEEGYKKGRRSRFFSSSSASSSSHSLLFPPVCDATAGEMRCTASPFSSCSVLCFYEYTAVCFLLSHAASQSLRMLAPRSQIPNG